MLTFIFFAYVKTEEMTEEQVGNYEEFLGTSAGSPQSKQEKTIDVKLKGQRLHENLMNINIGAEEQIDVEINIE